MALPRSTVMKRVGGLRKSVKKDTEGGWSRILRDALRCLFLDSSCGLIEAGVAVKLKGKPYLLKGKLQVMLGDGEGLQEAFQWKGAGGLLPCFKCENVVALGSDVATRSRAFVEIDCSDHRRFRERSEETLRNNVCALLEARRLMFYK